MRIIAVDPGYERMGVAILEKNKKGVEVLLYSGCLRTSPKLSFPERLFNLGEEFWLLMHKWKPRALAIEKIYFEKNHKTAIGVAEVKGMVSYIASSEKCTVAEFTPLEVKVAVTGYGRASKTEMIRMVRKLIHLDKSDALDDEYDAVAIGLTYLATFPQGK